VVSKGLKDGIFKGQEIVFANNNISILCKATEINRNYSLWVPVAKNANIPFNKNDFVSYNSSNYGNVSINIIGDANDITPKEDYNIEYRKFRTKNNFTLKASYQNGLFQSSSDVSADKNSTRVGGSYALEYNYRFMPEFEMSFGGRIDNEVYRIENPALDIPTSRTMATIAATYHLLNFGNSKNNFYLTLAAGVGTTTTIVNEETTSGIATLLPEVRLGYLIPFSKSSALLLELSVDSISAKETLADETMQVTNILNSKLTLGLRF
jgi:hypothetical protein